MLKKLIIDTDTGVDDAMAILMALEAHKRWCHIFFCAGETFFVTAEGWSRCWRLPQSVATAQRLMRREISWGELIILRCLLTNKLPKVLMIYHHRTLDAAGCPDIPVYRWWPTTILLITYNFLRMVHRRRWRTGDWCSMILVQNKLFSGVQKRHSLLLMITKSSTTDRMGSTMSSSQTRLTRTESKVK